MDYVMSNVLKDRSFDYDCQCKHLYKVKEKPDLPPIFVKLKLLRFPRKNARTPSSQSHGTASSSLIMHIQPL